MTTNLAVSAIETKIFTLRGVQVMIDRDLAELDGVEAKRRNELVAKFDRFESMKHSTTNPYAYTFVSDLIRQAKQYLALMAYCVFGLPRFARSDGFGFARSDVIARSTATWQSQKHNAQYKPITLLTFSEAHDRFLIIDETVYHIGASLKDLGKKWFAFSRIEGDALHLLEKVQNVLVHKGSEQ
jgi:hypothetical protein